ncbi:carboxypeptidase B [Anabrus simplex]|uniref:carboxypeptidase B n=1 Tax=Anabrus simplex TaxID=316456 RepID=UPI0035A3CE9B
MSSWVPYLQLGLLAVTFCLVHAGYKSFEGYKVYRLGIKEDQKDILGTFSGRRGFDVWAKKRIPEPQWDVMVSPALQDELVPFLDKNNISHDVIFPDVGQLMKAEKESHQTVTARSGSDLFKNYLDFDSIVKYLNSLAKKYKDLVTVDKIGQTTEGRDLKIIKISGGGGGKNPIILVDAGIHAREWVAPAMALYIINQLVENSTNKELSEKVDWHIIPVLNPDGYQYSRSHDRMWRKTRSKVPNSKCRGVDPNRNFDIKWGAIGVSKHPCSEIYLGPTAFSEPETVALRDYALHNKDRVKFYLTIHSYAGAFIYPWGYTKESASDAAEMKKLAEAASAANVAAGGSRLEAGNCHEILDDIASGGSDDWMKATLNLTYAYTLEMPGTDFTMPKEKIAKLVVPIFEAIRVFGQHVAKQYG